VKRSVALTLGRTLLRVGHAVSRLVPSPARKLLDDRVFYAVHQLTRVTNDHYPGTGLDGPPPAEE